MRIFLPLRIWFLAALLLPASPCMAQTDSADLKMAQATSRRAATAAAAGEQSKAADVNNWTKEEYTGALRHDPSNPAFNPDVRQLLHVGYKVAAKMGEKYLKMLKACEDSISRNVTGNLFDRHIRPIFLGD